MEPTSTSLATRDFLGSIGVKCRAELRHAATGARRTEPRYRTEARRARLPRPHSYARWPCTGEEPTDIRGYAATHPDFPDETSREQVFDESQWESYRRLGEHIGGRLFNNAVAGST